MCIHVSKGGYCLSCCGPLKILPVEVSSFKLFDEITHLVNPFLILKTTELCISFLNRACG